MQAGRAEAKEAQKIDNWNFYYPPRWNNDSKGIPFGRQITQISTDYKTEEETTFPRLSIEKIVIL